MHADRRNHQSIVPILHRQFVLGSPAVPPGAQRMAEYQKVAAQWRTRDATAAADAPAPRLQAKPVLVRSSSARPASKGQGSGPVGGSALHLAAEQVRDRMSCGAARGRVASAMGAG